MNNYFVAAGNDGFVILTLDGRRILTQDMLKATRMTEAEAHANAQAMTSFPMRSVKQDGIGQSIKFYFN